jgi:hypothetical protein
VDKDYLILKFLIDRYGPQDTSRIIHVKSERVYDWNRLGKYNLIPGTAWDRARKEFRRLALEDALNGIAEKLQSGRVSGVRNYEDEDLSDLNASSRKSGGRRNNAGPVTVSDLYM